MNVTGNLAPGVPKLRVVPGPGDWARRAACRGRNPDLWFRDEHDQTSYQEARAVCRACPVAQECLTWALDTDTWFGVFGGLSPRQRRQLKPGRRARRDRTLFDNPDVTRTDTITVRGGVL